MSDTPRTDAAVRHEGEPDSPLVWADFARTLERACAEREERIAVLEEDNRALRGSDSANVRWGKSIKRIQRLEATLRTEHNAREKAEREVERLREAIFWALGCGDWPERREGQGAFYWRSELIERAGITAEEIAAQVKGEGA
jgi:hypothetical protein